MASVQAEVTSARPLEIRGSIDGVPFCFRAGGSHWTMGIGADPVDQPQWQLGKAWGDEPNAADRMPEDVGRALIEQCCLAWRVSRGVAWKDRVNHPRNTARPQAHKRSTA